MPTPATRPPPGPTATGARATVRCLWKQLALISLAKSLVRRCSWTNMAVLLPKGISSKWPTRVLQAFALRPLSTMPGLACRPLPRTREAAPAPESAIRWLGGPVGPSVGHPSVDGAGAAAPGGRGIGHPHSCGSPPPCSSPSAPATHLSVNSVRGVAWGEGSATR
eukprot:2317483-Pyramimonas_sp.AAC.1